MHEGFFANCFIKSGIDVPTKKIILVVEDEALVRLIGADMLSDAGYEVLEADNADEALKVLASVDQVHMLFTDIRMPGSMNGLELAKTVHERWPEMKLLLTSGDTWPPKGQIPDDGKFLAKPYDMGRLRAAVQGLVG
jgi:DNA-binding NtrC family response regulator